MKGRTVMNFKKYTKQYHPVPMETRDWPNNEITHAPVWCSVDLRDGNQALYSPMTIEEKLEFFSFLVGLGIKEIEVGFPAASGTEFEFVRRLIDENLIPDDVTIQVLTQAREHIIKRTIEALQGAKNAIVHIYNSTSTLQRRVVFHKDKEEIKQLAIDGAKLVVDLVEGSLDGNIRYEYSPESFTCTEPDYAVEVCNAVLDVFKPTPEKKAIINLPSTIEVATANVYADQIEYVHKRLKYRDAVEISVHAHNDRGTGVASTELALLAGADRVEGTLFGNGERTGNADIIMIALNMFCQGIDPELNIDNIDEIIEKFEKFNKIPISPRHPYAGEMAYVAFSGSHQDAIKKAMAAYEEAGAEVWENPYLTIDPTDIGRKYEPIVINSQSGKGGVSYVMEKKFGYTIPPQMLVGFSKHITELSDKKQTVLEPEEIYAAFKADYINNVSPVRLMDYACSVQDGMTVLTANVSYNGSEQTIEGLGNGPLDALSDGLKKLLGKRFDIVSYTQHDLERKASSKAVSYICIAVGADKYWGVGVDTNISTSSIYALISAVNKACN